MTAWVVRGGRRGEFEEEALDKSVLIPGFGLRENLNDVHSKDELKRLLEQASPKEKEKTISAWAGEIWAFKKCIKPDDLVVMPRKRNQTIAIGIMLGEYAYHFEAPERLIHSRTVRWINPEIFRDFLDMDLRKSMNVPLTVCRIRPKNAEERLRAII